MAKSFLGSNTDSVDAFLQGTTSVFTNKRPVKLANMFMRHEDTSALGSNAWGQDHTFEPPLACDFLGRCDLIIKTAAATSTAATGNYPRFIDWIGYLAYDEVSVKFASNQLQRFSGLDAYIVDLVSLRSEDSNAIVASGGLSAATRATNAATANFEIICPLNLLFWVQKAANYLPYNVEVLRRPLAIMVSLKTVYKVIETDGTDLAQAINSFVLRSENYHVTQSERKTLYREVTEGYDESTATTGWSRMVRLVEPHSDITLSGVTTAQEVRLTQLRLPTREILSVYRAEADLASGALDATIQPTNFQAITNHRLQGYNENIHPSFSDKYNTHIMNRSHSGPLGSNVYTSCLSLLPESCEQFGYLNFSTVALPTEEITLAGATHINKHITVPTLGVVNLLGGDLRMLFA